MIEVQPRLDAVVVACEYGEAEHDGEVNVALRLIKRGLIVLVQTKRAMTDSQGTDNNAESRRFSRGHTRLTLEAKLGIALASVAVAVALLLASVFYLTTREQLRQGISERLHDAVAIGALQIDADAHSTLTEPAQEGNATYVQIQRSLQNMRDAATGIHFAYTMRQGAEGEIIFVVDAETARGEIAHMGEVYDAASPTLVASFATMTHPIVEEEFYTDKWGTWLTGYAPFYSSDGRKQGVLGMDIDAAEVIAQERRVLWLSLAVFGATVPLALAVGWMLGRRLARPIVTLMDGVERTAEGDFSSRQPVHSNDEIGQLAMAFNVMTDKLGQSLQGLKAEVAERKRAEEQLARHRDRLEETVGVRTAELTEANYRLQQDIVERERAREEREALLGELADMNARLGESNQSLRRLATYLQFVREEERAAVARELHDEVGQELATAKMDLDTLSGRLPSATPVAVHAALDRIDGVLNDTIARLRRLYTDLKPGMLDDLGLTATVEWQTSEFAGRSGIACQTVRLDPVTLPEDGSSLAIYRVFQEALDNVLRHSGATKVEVSVERHGWHATVLICDNGRGITEEELNSPSALGLAAMRERMRACGGTLAIRRRSEGGTLVEATVPLAHTKQGEEAL